MTDVHEPPPLPAAVAITRISGPSSRPKARHQALHEAYIAKQMPDRIASTVLAPMARGTL